MWTSEGGCEGEGGQGAGGLASTQREAAAPLCTSGGRLMGRGPLP